MPQPGSVEAPENVSDHSPTTIEPTQHRRAVLPEVEDARFPRHIAIIMDGNGRWARQRNLPRLFGHRQGAESVRRVLSECGHLGIEALTLFSFSSENWKRPREEVEALMALYVHNLRAERDELVRNNIRFRQIGRRADLSAEVLAEVDAAEAATSKCTGPTLCLAVNYGGRTEIVDAARALARRAVEGRLDPGLIDEAMFESALYTDGLPAPDLLVRTAGEMRLSNFLLWQISYAEIHVTDVLWPDFGESDLHAAIRAYAGRSRRFGGLEDAPPQ
ncbi:MAG: isoprenyl transferase [Planctomycetota bacterium]|nr:isoprenyl transferase [Planctomycetota bacterium]